MPPTRLRSVPRAGTPGAGGARGARTGPGRGGPPSRPAEARWRPGGPEETAPGAAPATTRAGRAAAAASRAMAGRNGPGWNGAGWNGGQLDRDGDPRDPRLATRRAFTLFAMTVVAPGSAQFVAGRRDLGRLALRIWGGFLAFVVLLGLAWLIHREFVLGLLTHQRVLRPLAVALMAAGIAWPVLVLDAWRLGHPAQLRVRNRRIATLLAVTLVVLTCLLPIATGRRVWAGADLLGGVFGSSRTSAAAGGRYNVLLLGGDAGPTRIGTRPDSLTLASIDEKNGRTVLISLPRNLQNVPFLPGTPAAKAMPNGWSCGDTCLLNAIYTWAGHHRDLFPGAKDPGAEAMKQVVQSVTGLKVNYYVLIDLQGFQSLIDAVGGIDIKVESRVPIGGETSKIHGYIEPGVRHLDGYHALWYGRSRTGTSDYSRMARQRCVMTAMINQLDPSTLLAHFQDIAKAGQRVVSTDIPAGQLPSFITLGTKAKTQKIDSVQFVPPLIVPHHPDFAVIRQKVAQALAANQKAAGSSARTASGPAAPAGTGSAGTGSADTDPSAPGGTGRTAPAATAGTGQPGPADGAQPVPAGAVDVRQVCQPA